MLAVMWPLILTVFTGLFVISQHVPYSINVWFVLSRHVGDQIHLILCHPPSWKRYIPGISQCA